MKYLIIALNLVACSFNQEPTQGLKKHVHALELHTAEYHINEWNSNVESKPHVVELVNEDGNVVELKFYAREKECLEEYFAVSKWVKYEYLKKGDTIIINELFFSCDGSIPNYSENEMPYKTEYKVFANEILSAVDYYSDINDGQKSQFRQKTEAQYVRYFILSFAKMKGQFPRSADFKKEYYHLSEAESRGIK